MSNSSMAIEDHPEILEPENAAAIPAEVIADAKVVALRSPTIHLKTMHDVRIEMAKVYRAMKTGLIKPEAGTRLTYVLSQIGRVIESDVIATRVEAVERVLRLRGD